MLPIHHDLLGGFEVGWIAANIVGTFRSCLSDPPRLTTSHAIDSMLLRSDATVACSSGTLLSRSSCFVGVVDATSENIGTQKMTVI